MLWCAQQFVLSKINSILMGATMPKIHIFSLSYIYIYFNCITFGVSYWRNDLGWFEYLESCEHSLKINNQFNFQLECVYYQFSVFQISTHGWCLVQSTSSHTHCRPCFITCVTLASLDGWAVWRVVLFTRWWLLVILSWQTGIESWSGQ